MAFRRPKSLGAYLVCAKVHSCGPKDLLLGTVKCLSRRCEICKYKDENSDFKSSKEDQAIKIFN